VFEGGLRVPFIAWWPGKVPAGRICGEFITALDVLPTIAKLVGAPLPPGLELDGYNVAPVLLGEKDGRSPRETLFSLYGLNQNRKESVRSGSWKLHLTTPPQLYDLSNDLGETNNIAAQHPDLVQRLTQLAADIRTETGLARTPR
jgi:arylsulfatase A-like enzyme